MECERIDRGINEQLCNLDSVVVGGGGGAFFLLHMRIYTFPGRLRQ